MTNCEYFRRHLVHTLEVRQCEFILHLVDIVDVFLLNIIQEVFIFYIAYLVSLHAVNYSFECKRSRRDMDVGPTCPLQFFHSLGSTTLREVIDLRFDV